VASPRNSSWSKCMREANGGFPRTGACCRPACACAHADRHLARGDVALNFAELSSHYPVAGSVFQWTKYLAGRTYAWFTGWMYLFAGAESRPCTVAGRILIHPPSLKYACSLSLRGTSGERAGERGSFHRIVALF